MRVCYVGYLDLVRACYVDRRPESHLVGCMFLSMQVLPNLRERIGNLTAPQRKPAFLRADSDSDVPMPTNGGAHDVFLIPVSQSR